MIDIMMVSSLLLKLLTKLEAQMKDMAKNRSDLGEQVLIEAKAASADGNDQDLLAAFVEESYAKALAKEQCVDLKRTVMTGKGLLHLVKLKDEKIEDHLWHSFCGWKFMSSKKALKWMDKR